MQVGDEPRRVAERGDERRGALAPGAVDSGGDEDRAGEDHLSGEEANRLPCARLVGLDADAAGRSRTSS
jgi:hypothetical protein